jgi:acyl dehydratase
VFPTLSQFYLFDLSTDLESFGSGVDELRWPRPVRPGDTLRLHCEIIDVQKSKLRPSGATVRVRMTTLNQHDQPVRVDCGKADFSPPW